VHNYICIRRSIDICARMGETHLWTISMSFGSYPTRGGSSCFRLGCFHFVFLSASHASNPCCKCYDGAGHFLSARKRELQIPNIRSTYNFALNLT
jgi:hypothetical protein